MQTILIKPDDAINKDIGALILNHLEFSTRNFQRWLDLLDDHAVIEFPYGESAGNAPRLEGKGVIAEVISEFLSKVPGIRFNHPVIYPTLNPDEAFATYDVDVRVQPTGRVYQQRYIGHFRKRGGKLVYLSEYFDPTKTIAAFSV